MHFARLAGFDQQADLRSFFVPHQVMMHSTRCHERTHGNTIRTDLAIGQHDQAEAISNCVSGLFADAIQGRSQATNAFRLRIGDIHHFSLPATMFDPLQICHLMVCQNRMWHCQTVTTFRLRIEQVAFRTNVTFQRHDDFFPDRIDRRICHLSEELMEVIVKHSRLITQACQGSIVTHRADRILVSLDQRQQHEVHRFRCVSERLHTIQQILTSESFRRGLLWQLLQANPLFLYPLLIRPPRCDIRLEFFVVDDSTLFKVHKEHAAWLQASLVSDVGGVDVQHADFAGHDNLVVLRHVIATWTQAIAIQCGTDEPTVGKGDRCRSVPRFLQCRIVFVKRALVFGHCLMILPCLRHHHHDDFLQCATGVIKHFQGIVEAAGVGRMRFNNRKQLFNFGTEEFTLHHALARKHPVGVALNSVDFAIVRHESKRLSTVPTGKRIGGKTRVNHGQMCVVVSRLQIFEKWNDLKRREHSLVNNQLGR